MKAQPIFEALAALAAVRALRFNAPITSELWSQVMRAEVLLQEELRSAGLTVAVDAPKPEQVAA